MERSFNGFHYQSSHTCDPCVNECMCSYGHMAIKTNFYACNVHEMFANICLPKIKPLVVYVWC